MISDLEQEFNTYLKEISALEDDICMPEFPTDWKLIACLQNHPQKKSFLFKNAAGKQFFCKFARDEYQIMLRSEYDFFRMDKFSFLPYVLDYIETPDGAFLVREYIEGRTLAELIGEDGPLSLNDALPIMYALCRAVSCLHNMNPPVIYRDIKPENIVLTSHGECFIIDMGTVRRFRENESSDTICMGTAEYAAPEQFGARQTDARTDVYGLGLLFFYLLTGRRKAEDALLRKLPLNAASLIRKATAFNPDDRYQDMQAFDKALTALKSDNKRFSYRLAAALSFAAALIFAMILLFIGIRRGVHGQKNTSAAKNTLDASSYAANTQTPDPQTGGTVTDAPDHLPAPEDEVVFSSALMARAVRMQLNKTDREPVYYHELKQITKLLICGNVIFENEDYFHEHYFAPHHLNGSETGTGDISDISLLAYMPNLTLLSMDYQNIRDISPLKDLDLAFVSLAGNPITDLSALSGNQILYSLDIGQTNVVVLNDLSGCTSLRYLNCAGTDIYTLSPLRGLSITDLYIKDTESLQDYSALETMPIEHLQCYRVPTSELKYLGKIPTLRSLTIYTVTVPSFRELPDLSETLTYLDVYNGRIGSFDGIERFSQITGLNISYNPLPADCSALSALTNLTYLAMSGIPCTDFSFLYDMPRLSHLQISESQLSALQESVPEPWFEVVY